MFFQYKESLLSQLYFEAIKQSSKPAGLIDSLYHINFHMYEYTQILILSFLRSSPASELFIVA